MSDYGELDDCYGVAGVTVTLTDADADVHEAVTNAAGNFWLTEDVPAPFTVVIEKDGATRAMAAAQSDGACATCHTETGENGAPGRVLVP